MNGQICAVELYRLDNSAKTAAGLSFTLGPFLLKEQRKNTGTEELFSLNDRPQTILDWSYHLHCLTFAFKCSSLSGKLDEIIYGIKRLWIRSLI